MATVVTRSNTFYGYPNPQGTQFPDPIVANRAPTQADKAVIGQLWVYPGTNSSYILSSINTSGQSVWTVLNIGGAGVFSSLQVNGPSIFAGNITQQAPGVTANLLNTTTAGLTNNGVFSQTGGVAIVGQIVQNTGNVSFTAPVLSNTGFTSLVNAANVLQTTCTAGGAFSIASVQLSDDNAGVLYSTFKRYTTGTITAGDRLYLHLINGQQGGADRLAAAIDSFSQTVGAGFVSADIGFTTTDTAGALARRLVISSQGQVNIATAGQTLGVQGGAPTDFIGQAVLGATAPGTVQVNNTNITANDKIFLSVSLPGGTQGFLSYAIAVGSFTITSTNVLDTSTVEYFIVRQI